MDKVKKHTIRRNSSISAYLLLGPSILILLAFISYPLAYNIYISFFDVPLNPKKAMKFIGAKNYVNVLSDPEFYRALLVTVLFTLVVVVLSTVVGLMISLFLNREFVGKKIVNGIIIMSYVIPAICLIFAWKYIFNSIYGIMNYLLIDVLHLLKEPPLWFDQPTLAFCMAVLFAVWKFFPYAYMSFNASLKTIEATLYEAAEIDGANRWQKFKAITYPALKPTLGTVVSLRIIWVFYIYAEVYLLTKQVNVIGVYLYDMAFATHDFGKAAAISILLSILIFGSIFVIRKKVFAADEE